jgi:hypothetical protein
VGLILHTNYSTSKLNFSTTNNQNFRHGLIPNILFFNIPEIRPSIGSIGKLASLEAQCSSKTAEITLTLHIIMTKN